MTKVKYINVVITAIRRLP